MGEPLTKLPLSIKKAAEAANILIEVKPPLLE
jgi:hypothetical protein